MPESRPRNLEISYLTGLNGMTDRVVIIQPCANCSTIIDMGKFPQIQTNIIESDKTACSKLLLEMRSRPFPLKHSKLQVAKLCGLPSPRRDMCGP